MKKMQSITIKSYKPSDFMKKYQEIVNKEMIPFQYRVLWDKEENVEKSHAILNFVNAGKKLRGEEYKDFYGMVFQDSDVAKWIEAASYSLAVFPDKELKDNLDRVVDIVEAAQDKNGYLNTRFTIKDEDKRWQNLLEAHELYCAGHMMEAACAYYEATENRKLIDVMLRNVEHIYDVFITHGAEGYPGHPEIELALLRMYDCTKDKHCLELAEHFIDCRGTDPHFYEKERAKRNWDVWGINPSNNDYQQASKPVRLQTEATGHSVRAGYLYTGMAALASENHDTELFNACERLWENIVNKRMYITGGIGSTYHGEAFTQDYDLPSDTAYAETCASIALFLFANRMLENRISNEYADIMEKAYYNTILSGIQIDGKKFFYVNPLEAIPGISGKSPTHGHIRLTRFCWHACACCPPNAARIIASIGKYAYSENENTVFCNLYASGDVVFRNGLKLSCRTEYPYDGNIKFRFEGKGLFAVRIPGWSQKNTITKNGTVINAKAENGYAYINIDNGDEVNLSVDISPRFVYPSQMIPYLSGKVAVCSGPLVYCFEGIDNCDDVFSLYFDTRKQPVLEKYDTELLGGTRRLTADGFRRNDQQGLYSSQPPKLFKTKLYGIPYCLWANRGENQMRIWIPIK